MSKNEDEVLAQLLASDAKGSSAGADSDANVVSGIDRTISGASSSNSQEYVDLDSLRETGSATPEELRQQAVDEKKKYKFLKGEGKPEEALKAFKRGKELERQAEALEIALRKSRRKVLPDEKLISAEPGREKKPRVGKDKDKDKDDLLSELKELGWSEMDLHNEDKKPASATVEGELSALIGELPQKPNDGKTKQGIDKTQIAAHKRKALMLKREGKLAEAKEELKRAKVLEKQVEEQELLAGAEDSDDELSALIRSMDDDKQENLPQQKQHDFRLDDLIGVAGNLDEESNFEVTEEDLADPEMTAALKSLGWAEDYNTELATQSVPFDRGALSTENPLHIKAFGHKQDVNASTLVSESFVTQGLRSSLDGVPRRSKAEVQRELLGFKRKALALRREGKNEEAEEVLKMAKTLEAQISEMEASKNKFNTEHAKLENNRVKISTEGSPKAEHEEDVTENDLRDPSLLSMLEGLGWKDEAPEPVKVQEVASKKITDSTLQSVNAESTIVSSSVVSTSAPRTKTKMQRELLGLKRRALDLRRKGKLEEAEETLRMAKALEMEIEELELPKGPRVDASEKRNPESLSSSIRHEEHGIVDNAVKVNDGPTQEAASLDVGPMNLERTRTNRADTSPEKSYFWKPEAPGYGDESMGSQKFAQGDMAAKGGASSPKVVHSVGMMDLLTGSNWRNTQVSAEKIEERPCYVSQSSHDIPPIEAGAPRSADEDRTSKDEVLVERKETQKNKPSQVNKTNTGEEHQKRQVSIQQEILIHKKKAVALKREGRLAEAKEALKQAKLLESLEEDKPQPSVPISSSTIPPVEIKEEDTSKVTPKPLSSRERFKIQQESLSHKRQALKLRKEGRIKDAEAEFDLAKTLEAQLEESASHDPVKSSEDGMDDEVVEDLLDPELLSALKAIGIDDSSMVSQGSKKREPVKHNLQSRENSGQDSIRLEEQIKAEKVKAVNLKRAGKQAEALDALRHAKMLEKKLNAF